MMRANGKRNWTKQDAAWAMVALLAWAIGFTATPSVAQQPDEKPATAKKDTPKSKPVKDAEAKEDGDDKPAKPSKDTKPNKDDKEDTEKGEKEAKGDPKEKVGPAPKITSRNQTLVGKPEDVRIIQSGVKLINDNLHEAWKENRVQPAPFVDDFEFIRRASLDIIGRVATADEINKYLRHPASSRRPQIIEDLLAHEDYPKHWGVMWANWLLGRSGVFGRGTYHDGLTVWLEDQFAQNRTYDKLVTDLVTAKGKNTERPAVNFILAHMGEMVPQAKRDQDGQFEMVPITSRITRLFLGMQLQCAQCHHHPYERWSQDDYWGLAAYFGRLGRKNVQAVTRSGQQQNNNQRSFYYNRPSGTVLNKRNNKPIEPTALDGKSVALATEEDPRAVLADWLTSEKNPFYAKAVANRYWAHFFDRGVVEPLDDMRVTNPPSNPALLEALAKHVVEDHYSLRSLCRRIVTSEVYRLSSDPVEGNAADKQSFARYYPKRMNAEVLFDAVHQVAGSPATFPGLPADKFAPTRAIMLPDESFSSYFLDVFGRPQRLSPCECERVTEANLAQVLHLLNSEEVQTKISRVGARADLLAKDTRPDAAKVDELFQWAVGHKPTDAKRKLAVDHLSAAKSARDKKQAWDNLVWALLNSQEFSWIR